MKFIFLSAVLFLSTTIFSQKSDIKGNVKSIREKVISIEKEVYPKSTKEVTYIPLSGEYGEFGIINPRNTEKKFRITWIDDIHNSYINYKKEFNQKGLLTNETWYYSNKKIAYRWEYSYNKNDSLIQNKKFFGDNTDFTAYNITYDYQNRRKSEFHIASDNPNYGSMIIYEYDLNSNIKKISMYSSERGYENSAINFYNTNNKGTDVKIHVPYTYQKNEDGSYSARNDSVGTLYQRKKYIYDDKGMLTEILRYRNYEYNAKNELSNRIIYKYDKLNNLIEESYANPDTVSNSKFYSYNEKKQKIRYVYKSKYDNIEIDYIYDNNLLIGINYKNKEQYYTIIYKYKFDKKGNWVKQIKFVNGKPKHILKRKIKYFN
ncbi:hypothetical protein ABGT15_03010 [Flavobacterium enshiense]|uniref:hypothetical protein n=1 Tax=Flavobacterium enshiense TaxID=1341165 RepID=UPI00345D7585